MEPWAKRLQQIIDSGKDAGLSMQGLIKATKAKQPSVWQWFKAPAGKKTTEKVRAEYLVRAAIYAGTSVEYLVTGKNFPASQPARLDAKKLAALIETVETATAGRTATPAWKASIVATLYADPNAGDDLSAVKAALRSILNSVERTTA